MRWMTGQRVPSLRLVHTPMWTASFHPLELFVHALVPDAVSLLIAAVAAEEGLQKQLLFPVLRKGSGALVKGF